MEIYLIRHTSPKVEKGICYGQSDVPLADSFQNEAATLTKHLPETFDGIYSSPLSRCFKLAQLLVSKQEVLIDKRLLEMNFGAWELKKWNDIELGELNSWMQDFVNVKVPGGENFIELYNRAGLFFDELISKDYKTVAIVTHAGVIRSMVAKVLEIPLKNAFKIPVDYSSVTKLTISGENCFSNIAFLNKL
ncbi:MAG TPA: alpha-ribazole phosphatase [Bacteroidia bacterium]|jgi:alpha-ribazole phosphatase|nr:alpha-ribazole phosphatase [Bacteroidia bacterium]